MLSFLPAPLKGALAFLLICLNTIILVPALMLLTLLKLLFPILTWQKWMTAGCIVVAEVWQANNRRTVELVNPIQVDLMGAEGLHYHGWYLVSCNHQSWSDILILQHVFNRRIPMLKFFLKQELIWVPLLGVAWWALDFPFMKRYSKSFLEKHPELKGKDLETTKKACEKFKRIPVSVMNFLEGTRFTHQKQKAQQSPYQHLLKPKTGGVAFVLSAMGGQLRSMLDVTIVYHDDDIGFWDLLSGRTRHVSVHVTERQIPEGFSAGDYENDAQFRAEIQDWVSGIWVEKDRLIGSIKAQSTTT